MSDRATAGAVMTELIVPDARLQPVPLGWWETTAAPRIQALETWDELDEAEANLLAMASIIESLSGDVLEYEKALRVVEMRRGELAGPDLSAGRPAKSDTRAQLPEDTSPRTVSRWRTIARGWDVIAPHLRAAKTHAEVTQAQCLRLLDIPLVARHGHAEEYKAALAALRVVAELQPTLEGAYLHMNQAQVQRLQSMARKAGKIIEDILIPTDVLVLEGVTGK